MTIRASGTCNLFVLDKGDFDRVLRDHPQFAETLREQARKRYHLAEGVL